MCCLGSYKRPISLPTVLRGRADPYAVERMAVVGLDDLAEIWAKVTPAPEEKGMKLAGSELRALRKERREEGGS